MAEYLKSIPGDDDRLTFHMDRQGFDLFRRVIDRAQPGPRDNAKAFNAAKDRVLGAFLAGAIVKGWEKK